jgi:hypothetical protein
MATKKISDMNAAVTPLTGAELLEVSQLTGGVYDTFNASSEDLAYAACKYGIVFDASDQTFTANTATAVEFDTPGLLEGITLVSSTRLTFASAGVYEITARLQFENADSSDHDAKAWFRLSGTDIVNSASVLTVPKAADGGAAVFAITGLADVAAGQYMQIIVAVENANVSLAYTAGTASPYVSPAVPSAIMTAKRIAL